MTLLVVTASEKEDSDVPFVSPVDMNNKVLRSNDRLCLCILICFSVRVAVSEILHADILSDPNVQNYHKDAMIAIFICLTGHHVTISKLSS